jgi:hypothetical protein
MRYWVTPFPLSATARNTLIDAGLQPWLDGRSSFPDADSLLLFDSPDQLINTAGAGSEAEALTPQSLLQGYRRLLVLSEQTGQRLLSISQLQRLGPKGLRIWLSDAAAAFPSPPQLLPIPPLLASVSLSLLENEPALLGCYHDLELRAVLLGRDPDLRYQERLLQACQEGDALLQAFLACQRAQAAFPVLELRLASKESEMEEAREASEQTLLKLHQAQQALERAALVEGDMVLQLKARDRELQELRQTKAAQDSAQELATAAQECSHEQELVALRQQLESRHDDLERRLASRDTELREAKQATELTLQQLCQVQEELEQYFLADRDKQRLLEAGVRDLDELRQTKAAQESAHELAKDTQARVHELELKALREQFEPQMVELGQRLASRDTELREAREEAAITQLQLRQVQEELEHYFLADSEKQRQLEAGVHDLKELEQGLASRDTELRQARESAQLSIEQLHQVQEELEHYFLKARASDQLVQSQLEQLQRAQALMVRLHPSVLPTAPYPSALEVEVLPDEIAAMPDLSLQTQALLSTYAASLQRAGALLARVRRS